MLKVTNSIGLGSGDNIFVGNPVACNGSSYLQRIFLDLDNNSDTKSFTLSFWLRASNYTDDDKWWFSGDPFASPEDVNFSIQQTDSGAGGGSGSNRARILGYSTSNVKVLDIQTSTWIVDNWYNVLVSSDGTTAQIYVNDSSDLNTDTLSDTAIDFTSIHHIFLNGASIPVDTFTGDIAEFYLNIGTRIDFSITANRRKFITADLKPANVGATATVPTGSQPIIYMKGAATNFNAFLNFGNGGNWTSKAGAFTDGSVPVIGNT